jgi:aryl-alcohol dehydrogenase-like predicted oxidoreductase
MLKGFATVSGTRKYLKEKTFSKRETPWFDVSPIAIGTHLGERDLEDSLLYRDAIHTAVLCGINFIDTAINYRGMRSERDIGIVLSTLVDEGKLKREDIVVSTKAGIIPGDIEAGLVPADYLQKNLLEPGIIAESDLNIVEHHRHVLAPSYFSFAIEQSRKHLNLDTIDIHYLHNPSISKIVLGADEFYKQLRPLFKFYEEQVERENIRHYGMATWDDLLVEPSDPEYISLEKVVEVAKSVAGSHHHFRFVQLPFNKKMNRAEMFKNQSVNGEWITPLQAIETLGLYATISAPLAQAELFDETTSAHDLLRYVLETPGVFAAMVGMKKTAHVLDNVRFLEQLG